jgi:putative membrane protein
MKWIGWLAIVLAASVAVGCSGDNSTAARNDSTVGTAGENENRVSNGDQTFVTDLTVANMAEVELGRMATEKGMNAQVKTFGQMMIDDHTMAGDKLKAIASQHRIEVPIQLDDKHRELHDKLAALQGAEFDREYIKAMVDGHQDVLNKLEDRVDKNSLGASNAAVLPEHNDDPITMSVNQWAADSYPKVMMHLDSAKSIDSALSKRTTQ